MKNLKTKDLIYSGTFAVLYMIVAMITSMIVGIVPFLSIYGYQVVVGIACSTIYFMFVMKLKKFGAITILATLIGIMGAGSGHIFTLFLAFPIGLIADFVCKIGKYESKTMYNLSYIIFNLLSVTPTLTFITAKDATIQLCIDYYGQDYGDAIELLITNYMLYVQIVLAIIGGILGVIFAQKMLKKHFSKVGMG
ncbi:MAG: MptD family putative ECF transporter S component [Clostridia bacterium]